MSDSRTEIPSGNQLSDALRNTVILTYRAGKTDDLTVKRIRTKTEHELGLPLDFFKSAEWKSRSSAIIHAAVASYDAECGPVPSPQSIKKSAQARSPTTKGSGKGYANSGKRAAAPAATKPQKRRKVVSSDDESEVASPQASARTGKSVESKSKVSKDPISRSKQYGADSSDSDGSGTAPADRSLQTAPGGNASDSDMSSLIDESPVRSKRQVKSSEKKSKAAKPAKLKSRPQTKAEEDPDQAEVKRLQGWLVKCGIRKVWGKELAKCDGPKDKITHLKSMLSDAGMEGKYSVEKAARIKEKREFEKDLEDIQVGEAAWGKHETTATGRPSRSAARAAPKSAMPAAPSSEGSNEDPQAEEENNDYSADDGGGSEGASSVHEDSNDTEDQSMSEEDSD